MTPTTSPAVVFKDLTEAASPQVDALDEATQKLAAVQGEVLSALKQDPQLANAHDMQDLLLQFKVTLAAAQVLRRKMAQVPGLPRLAPVPASPSLPPGMNLDTPDSSRSVGHDHQSAE